MGYGLAWDESPFYIGKCLAGGAEVGGGSVNEGFDWGGMGAAAQVMREYVCNNHIMSYSLSLYLSVYVRLERESKREREGGCVCTNACLGSTCGGERVTRQR